MDSQNLVIAFQPFFDDLNVISLDVVVRQVDVKKRFVQFKGVCPRLRVSMNKVIFFHWCYFIIFP